MVAAGGGKGHLEVGQRMDQHDRAAGKTDQDERDGKRQSDPEMDLLQRIPEFPPHANPRICADVCLVPDRYAILTHFRRAPIYPVQPVAHDALVTAVIPTANHDRMAAFR